MAIRIGDIGKAVTAMTPSGYVEINGRRHDARSEFGAIEAGSDVVILRGDTTGFVVRKIAAGVPPVVPNRGEEVAVAAVQRTTDQVEEGDRRDASRVREEYRLRLHAGVMAASSLGGLVGLTSACLGWFFVLHGRTTPTMFLALVGGHAGTGLMMGVLLFVVTGLFGKLVSSMHGEPAFAPSFIVILTTAVGAGVGFWWKYDTASIGGVALGTIMGMLAGVAVGYVLRGCVGVTVGFVGGK